MTGKEHLVEVLRQWYDAGATMTIGDVGSYGGRPWLFVALDEQVIGLNADTKRAAVARYLEHVGRHGVAAPWFVVANARGAVNKVLFSDVLADSAGWYAYLRRPASAPAVL